MGFFDREVNGDFDRMFDLNNDGMLDTMELGLQYSYIDAMSKELEGYDSEDDDNDYY